jgi:hypothetical protein
MLRAIAKEICQRLQVIFRGWIGGRKPCLVQFLLLDRSQRTCTLTFYPFDSTETKNPSGGNLSFSIIAQMRSRSLPSDPKVSSLAWNTSVQKQLRQLHRPAPQRVYTSWQIWCGILRWKVSQNADASNDHSYSFSLSAMQHLRISREKQPRLMLWTNFFRRSPPGRFRAFLKL